MTQDKPSSAAIKPPQDRKPGQRKVPRKISPEYLHNAGLYYLQRFASGSANFRQVMLRKVKRSCMAHPGQDYETCKAMVENLVAKFEASGLLDDTTYLNNKIASLRRRGLSRQAIITRLQAKGFKENVVSSSIRCFDENHMIDNDDAEMIAALIHARRKRLGPFSVHAEENFQKSMESFARKGFKFETIRFVLKSDRQEAEDILHKHGRG